MAVDNRQLEMLANSIKELVTTLNKKNSAGSRSDSESRTGRGGNSNGISAARKSTANVEALANSLSDLHKSMKSGGTSISDTFIKLAKSVHPLEKAFNKLDATIDRIAESQNSNQKKATRAAQDFIKANKGNIDSIKEYNKESDELVSILSEIVKDHTVAAKDYEKYLKDVARIQEIAKKQGIELGDTLHDTLEYLKIHPDTKLKEKTAKKLDDDLRQLSESVSASSQVFGVWIKQTENSIKRAQMGLENSMRDAVKRLTGAISTDVKKIDGFISSRLQHSFTSNEFTNSALMGLSPDEFNSMRGSLRDVIDGLNGFNTSTKRVTVETLKDWTHANKQIGLIGAESAEFAKNMMRDAYNTGRRYSGEQNQQMIEQASIISRTFGVPVAEAGALLTDYNSQIYNINKFNKAQTEEQKAVVQDEITRRMLLNKHLGYSVEFMKQQEQMTHNKAFSSAIERFKSSLQAGIGLTSIQGELGWSDEETRLFQQFSTNNVQLDQLSTTQQDVLQRKLIPDFAKRENSKINKQGSLALSDQWGTEIFKDIMPETLFAMSGMDRQRWADTGATAEAIQNARRPIDSKVFLDQTLEESKKQLASLSKIDESILSLREVGGGVAKSPIGATAQTAFQVGGDVLMKAMELRFAGRLLGGVLGKGGTGAASSGVLSKALPFVAKHKGALLKGGGVGAIGGIGADMLADHLGRDTAGGASASVASYALQGAGVGMLLAPFTGGLSMPIGAAIGAGYGLYKNAETLGLSKAAATATTATSSAWDSALRTPLSESVDKANNIIRDDSGKIISMQGSEKLDLNKIANLLEEQNKLMKDERVETRERYEHSQQIAERKRTVQDHMNYMMETTLGQFTV